MPFDVPSWNSSVLASCQNSERKRKGPVRPLLLHHSSTSHFTHLQVHVVVCANQEALVLVAPLQTNKHRLAGLHLQKRLWVDGRDLDGEKEGQMRQTACV